MAFSELVISLKNDLNKILSKYRSINKVELIGIDFTSRVN